MSTSILNLLDPEYRMGVLSIVRSGYRIFFLECPSHLLLLRFINTLRQTKGNVEGYLTNLQVLNCLFRPILDLKNFEKVCCRVQVENIRKFLLSMEHERTSSIDMDDALLHIMLHPNSRKYVRFQVGD